MERPPTVLVIDDDPAVLGVIRLALEDEGYRVVYATGAAGLDVARKHQPDLILLDILMPGTMNGVEISQRLRSGPATRHIPIISMSGHMPSATPFAMQADEHLPKPLDLVNLCVTIERWIGRPRP